MYCPRITNQSPAPAYEVRYSYRGQPMASDEYGNTHFTFSVYFRPEELDPELTRRAASGRINRAAAAEFFQLTTSRKFAPQIVIDEASSTFCEGNYVDGNWARANPKCEDHVLYKVVARPSSYVAVKVEPSSRLETVAVTSDLWRN
jgi:hypothetical protein